MKFFDSHREHAKFSFVYTFGGWAVLFALVNWLIYPKRAVVVLFVYSGVVYLLQVSMNFRRWYCSIRYCWKCRAKVPPMPWHQGSWDNQKPIERRRYFF